MFETAFYLGISGLVLVLALIESKGLPFTYFMKRRLSLQSVAASYGFAGCGLTNALHYAAISNGWGDDATTVAYPVLHIIGGIGCIMLWASSRGRVNWLWMSALLFAWSLCADVAYNGAAASLRDICRCENPRLPFQTRFGYAAAQNAFFVMRELLICVGPLGLIRARHNARRLGIGPNSARVGANVVGSRRETL